MSQLSHMSDAHRRIIHCLRWGGGVLCGILLAYGMASAWIAWQTKKSEATRDLASFSVLGAQSLDTYLIQLESAFEVMGEYLSNERESGNKEKTQERLRRFLHVYPALSSIRITPAEGGLASSAVIHVGTTDNLPSQNTFSQARPARAFRLGLPYVDGQNKACLLPVRYVIQGRGNNSGLVVQVILLITKLQPLWDGISSLPKGTVFGLIGNDGQLLSCYPTQSASAVITQPMQTRLAGMAQRLRENDEVSHAVKAGREGRTEVAGTLLTFQGLQHYPLALFAVQPMTTLIASWLQATQSTILILGLLLLGLAAVYRWMEKRLMALEAERGQAEQHFRLAAHAIEHTADGIMTIGADRHIISVNKGFVHITGYAESEVIGRLPPMLKSGRHDVLFYKTLWKTLDKKGSWEGEIWDERKNGQLYAQQLSLSVVRNANRQVTHYVGTFSDISQYKDYEACLEFLANHDPLTNLPNRMLFTTKLEETIVKASQEEARLGVMFIDLDRFKMINDSLGHEVGDRFLQEIASRLRASVRPGDTVARLGGDEFTVVLDPLESIEEAALIAERLLTALSKPAEIDAHQLFVSASIGISRYPEDGLNGASLLKHADIAMYRAKEEGRDKFKFFAGEMNRRAQEFMLMANSLHVALERNEISIEYQPRIDLARGCIAGVEALARWQHPQLGAISPEKFIPLAEETGLIVPIGEWVLQSACKQGKAWLDAGYPVQIAVNLSALQFRKPGLVNFILETLQATGYPAQLLEIEITESSVMDDPEGIKHILNEISQHGIRIAIDDFGTGYSSLSYLKQFPIDYLKIDKSFVRDTPQDPDSSAIVKTIIVMAKSLRLSLIAEGVETEAQYRFLLAQGCEAAQGFHFSRSLPAADLLPLFEKRGIAQPLHAALGHVPQAHEQPI